MAPAGILGAILREADGADVNLAAWGLAWARVLPTVLIVPAFGFGILPVPLRVAMGFVLGVAVLPGIHPSAVVGTPEWPLEVIAQFTSGVPVALAATVSLWAATVAGGVNDTALFGDRSRIPSGKLGVAKTPLAALLGFAAVILFLENGGATAIAARLVAPAPHGALHRAVFDLANGVGIGASVGAPLLVVALVVDLTSAVAARELPAPGAGAWAGPLRALVVLVATAVLLDRMTAAVAVLGSP